LYISNINRHNETLFGNCSTQQTCLSSENNKECSAQNPLIENIANHLLNKMINIGDENLPAPVMTKIQVSQSSYVNATDSKPSLNLADMINQPKYKYRRTRLHWDTLRKIRSTSIWAMLNKDPDVDLIEIDETEFAELFQSEDNSKLKLGSDNARESNNYNVVKVVDSKRANNRGIILARF